MLDIKRVRQTFIGVIILVTALLVIIPVTTLYLQTREYDARIRTETANASLSISQTVRAFIDGAYSLSYELAVNPAILTMDGSLQAPILEDCARRNEYLELLFIQGTDGNQTARSSGELGYRGGREWFLQVMEHRQPFVYKSYYSLTGHVPVTSVFIPMFRDSELVGVFGADISLQYFQQLALQFEDEEQGRLSFIIDGEGVVVAHPDITLLETITNLRTRTCLVPVADEQGNKILNPDGSVVTVEQEIDLSEGYRDLLADVMAGNRGLDIITVDGIVYYASYESIAMPGYSDSWSVITLQDRDIAMSSIYVLMLRMLIIISIILVVFFIAAYGFFKSLVKTMNNLESARLEAEEANRSKSAFLSTMSHEIRTPLNAILGITEMLLQRSDINKEVRASLERTHSSGNMLLGIINDILDLSKIEAGRLELFDDKYETASLISDTVQLNMLRIGSKQIDFELIADENLPAELIGDELRVKQILNNLLSNAFKYTDEGKVTLTVGVEDSGLWKAEGGGIANSSVVLAISVSDTGQGMTEDQVSMLFGEYTRFNIQVNRKTEGSGLGLSITKTLVEMMGGDISVESRFGEGSVFTVHIRQRAAGFAVIGKEMSENLRRFRAKGDSYTRHSSFKHEPMPYGYVLLVDDVESNIFVAEGLLTPYGLKIDKASSGPEAIKKVEEGNVYDIIFMDYMMPEMDGIEATKRIRDTGYEHPIVALTADAVSGQAEMLLANGFTDFISKPIDMRQMNSVLIKLIRSKQPTEVIEAAQQNAASPATARGPKDGPSGAADAENDFTRINPQLIRTFLHDAEKAMAVLSDIDMKNGEYDEDDIKSLTISMHGLKSVLIIIGMANLSDEARLLECFGRAGSAAAIAKKAPSFLESLRSLTKSLAEYLAETGQNGGQSNGQSNEENDSQSSGQSNEENGNQNSGQSNEENGNQNSGGQ